MKIFPKRYLRIFLKRFLRTLPELVKIAELVEFLEFAKLSEFSSGNAGRDCSPEPPFTLAVGQDGFGLYSFPQVIRTFHLTSCFLPIAKSHVKKLMEKYEIATKIDQEGRPIMQQAIKANTIFQNYRGAFI